MKLALTCHMPGGAFYAFPSIESTGLSSQEFAEQLLKQEGVAVVPGDVFGESGEGHIRCSYAYFDRTTTRSHEKDEKIYRFHHHDRSLKRRLLNIKWTSLLKGCPFKKGGTYTSFRNFILSYNIKRTT